MTASRSRTFAFVMGALMAGAIAQAQQPPPPNAKPAAASAPSTPSASHSAQKAAADGKPAAARAVETSAVTKPADPSPELLRDARNAGFRTQEVRGNLMFCRVAVELGSNFPVRTCYNEEQVKIKIHEYQTQRNQLEQQRFLPTQCSPQPHC